MHAHIKGKLTTKSRRHCEGKYTTKSKSSRRSVPPTIILFSAAATTFFVQMEKFFLCFSSRIRIFSPASLGRGQRTDLDQSAREAANIKRTHRSCLPHAAVEKPFHGWFSVIGKVQVGL
ncbi:hypothetical protein CEXT_606381 [Caerostris extrusa]|uniref:Uncharacterized protein n=1 Tax=Caerostris extrusa TaxID=172846 RepID=A0AAV4RE68_CAEEX|nr:hypothetical protein CEXT_606381 [Caerostris extrusa]